MSIDVKDAARQIITNHAEDIESDSIGEYLAQKIDIDEIGEEAFDALKGEIGDVIDDSAVTVTLPGDPVCTSCGGTGQPGDDDGTPRDLPQWENLRALLADQWAATADELVDQIMALFGGEPGC